jgi:hypothetical protein
MNARLCCGYLRVYQPVEQLPVEERERAGEPRRRRALAGSLGLIAPTERLETFVMVVDDRTYACPARTRLRTILGMVAFERMVPEEAKSVFFSAAELRSAHRELEELQTDPARAHPSMLQSAWHVPLQWFVCFDDSERRIVSDDYGTRITYVTPMTRARERVQYALDTLKGGIVHPVVIGVIFELSEWLNSFGGECVVELDYASLATLFDPAELADDHGAADVWSAIRALGVGDGMKAALHYRNASERWMRTRGREALN